MSERRLSFPKIEPAQDEPTVFFPVEMYEVSGHKKITGKVFDRYERSKRYDAAIEGMSTEADLFLEKYNKEEPSKKYLIILEGLDSDDVLIQREAASLFNYVLGDNPEKHKECVKKAITISDRMVQSNAIYHIEYFFDNNEKYEYTKEVLSQSQCDPYICKMFAKNIIPYITPIESQKSLQQLAGDMITRNFFDDIPSPDNQFQYIHALQQIPFQTEHIPIIEKAIQEIPSPTPLLALDIVKKNREKVPFYNLLLLAIDRPEKEIQKKALEMSVLLKDEEKRSFLEILVSHENSALQYEAVLLQEKDLSKRDNAQEIIEKGLENPDTNIQRIAAKKIPSLREQSDQIACIQKAIHLQDFIVNEKVTNAIFALTNNEDKKRVIDLVLESENFELQERIIDDLNKDPLYSEISAELKEKMKAYKSNGLDHRRFALYSKVLSPSDRKEMESMFVLATEELITSTNREEQESGIAVIASLSEEKRFEYYLQCLQIKDSAVIEKMIDKALIFLTEQQQIVFFAEALRKDDFSLQRKIIEKMRKISFDSDLKELLFNQAKFFSPKALIASPLYDNRAKAKTTRLARSNFEKTGSGTTLLVNTLQEKVIIRHISPRSFKAWKEIYEDFDSWKKAQFDYVPIEPILSFQPNQPDQKENSVDVMSGVLDCSVETWLSMTQEYKQEIMYQIQNILNVLKKQGIDHGHPHPDNFCLRFFRTDDNQIDFSRAPRVYIIDFDRAKKVL